MSEPRPSLLHCISKEPPTHVTTMVVLVLHVTRSPQLSTREVGRNAQKNWMTNCIICCNLPRIMNVA